MPQTCSHCHTEQPEENRVCSHCGKPLPEVWFGTWRPPVVHFVDLDSLPPVEEDAEADPVQALQMRRSQWKAPLFLSFLAVGILFLIVGVPLLVGQKRAANKLSQPAQAPPQEEPQAVRPAAKPSASPPMALNLRSVSENKHVAVGSHAMISASVSLAPGQSALVDLAYQTSKGPRTVFAFAHGSFCSALWTPLTPGPYEFTATAVDNQQHSVSSRKLVIWADQSLPAAGSITPMPVLPMPITALAPPAPPLPHTRREAGRVSAESRPRPALPTAPVRYHVVAANFPFTRNAEVFANALRQRGFHAVVRKGIGKGGKDTYRVETGIYPYAAAQKQSQTLQRNGYPAYCFAER